MERASKEDKGGGSKNKFVLKSAENKIWETRWPGFFEVREIRDSGEDKRRGKTDFIGAANVGKQRIAQHENLFPGLYPIGWKSGTNFSKSGPVDG